MNTAEIYAELIPTTECAKIRLLLLADAYVCLCNQMRTRVFSATQLVCGGLSEGIIK